MYPISVTDEILGHDYRVELDKDGQVWIWGEGPGYSTNLFLGRGRWDGVRIDCPAILGGTHEKAEIIYAHLENLLLTVIYLENNGYPYEE